MAVIPCKSLRAQQYIVAKLELRSLLHAALHDLSTVWMLHTTVSFTAFCAISNPLLKLRHFYLVSLSRNTSNGDADSCACPVAQLSTPTVKAILDWLQGLRFATVVFMTCRAHSMTLWTYIAACP